MYWVEVTQSCLTFCDPMDYRIHGILQARILERVAILFSRGSSRPRDWTQVSRTAGRFSTIWATREAPYWMYWMHIIKFWWIKRCIMIKPGFLGGSNGKESACNAGDLGSIPGSGISPGERNGNPLQYSCLENSMDREAWWVTVHGVAKSRTWLSY